MTCPLCSRKVAEWDALIAYAEPRVTTTRARRALAMMREARQWWSDRQAIDNHGER